MSSSDLANALCVLVPLASALFVRVAVSRLSRSGSTNTQERQPVEKKRRHPYWTHQRLRDHLDNKYGGRIVWSRRCAYRGRWSAERSSVEEVLAAASGMPVILV